MSTSSEDEYSNAANKLQAMKQNWNPGIASKVDTVDSDCPSDSDKSPLVLDHPSPKVTKNKKFKKRIPAKKISATDSTGSTESDISRTCTYLTRAQVSSVGEQENSAGEGNVLGVGVGGTSGVLARSRRARGTSRRTGATRGTRRSRGRNRFANPQHLINLGCWSDEEGAAQPMFAKPQSKDIVEVELDASDLVNYFDKESSDKESENEELSVKVHWRSKEYHKFPIRKYQKLTKIFEFYSELEGVPADHLLLTLKERILRPQDTPADINYNVWDFIEGGVVANSVTQMAEESARKYSSGLAVHRDTSAGRGQANGRKLNIKLQSKDMKTPFKVAIGKDQKFSFAMVKFAEEFEIPLNKLKFYFDGDLIDREATPGKLDMEDGECIDVVISA